MELRHLRYFVAVAEELNFSRAALRLDMTQPSLSRQIRDLETELGAGLFERQPRQLLLTPAGQFFLEQARNLLNAADLAVAQTRQFGRGEVGQLAVGYNTDQAGCGLFPAILQSFRQQYSNITLSLHNMELSRQVVALQNREIDLGFSIRLGKEAFTSKFPGLCWKNLTANPLIAALPARHALAGNESVSLKDLAAQPFVWSSGQLNPRTGDYTPTIFEEAGFLPQRFVTGRPRNANQFELVEEGLGVSLANKTDLIPEGVVFRPLAEEFFGCHTLVWTCANGSAVLKSFIELAITTQTQPGCYKNHF